LLIFVLFNEIFNFLLITLYYHYFINQVAKTQPIISLNCTSDLLAGLAQRVELVVSSGSVKICDDSKLKLRTSRGLMLSTIDDNRNRNINSMMREIELILPMCEPFDTTSLKLMVLAELPPKKDSSSMEHKVSCFSIKILNFVNNLKRFKYFVLSKFNLIVILTWIISIFTDPKF
jgi:hypothetical protein